MSDGYDIIGLDVADILGDLDDDDEMGAIGYDLIGDDDDDDDDDDLDLIGEDEDEALLEALSVSGAGDSELIGARRRRRRRLSKKARAARKRKALRRLAMRKAGAVVRRGLDRRRRYPLGFVPTTIASGASAAVPAAPQNLFRPERLVIPSDIAFDIGVRDIKVGNQSQLVQSVEVPGALFSEVAIGVYVTFDTAEVGNQVSVDSRNKSAVDLEFAAGLVGAVAK